MNITRFNSMLVLLCLFFAAQRIDAQCNISPSAVVTNINCFGEAGTIDLTVSGGTAPYTFAWSDGQTDEDITVLSYGLYIVTVTDGMGCVTNLARNISGPASTLSLVLNDDGIVTCQNPQSDITPTISGGTVPYTFLWSNGKTTDVIPVTIAGTYTLTITDAKGCTISDSRAISVSVSYPVADAGPDQLFISCATAPNIIGGGATSIGPEFVYEWYSFIGGFDPGVDITQPSIEVTGFGDYRLRVTNTVFGCSAEDLIFVTPDNSFPVFSAQAPPQLSCQVNQVTLNAIGSSTGPQYSYQWTTSNGHIVSGATTLTPVVDAPGNYILTISDNQVGCTKKGQLTVISQGTHFANAGPDTGIPCGGNQITLDGSGSSTGVGYTHQWSTLNGNIVSGDISLNPTVDQPGTYTLLVVDTQTGCTKTDDVKVFPGPAIPEANFSVLDVSCTGQLGLASVGMTQGTPPYTYLWSNGSTQDLILNVGTGTYTVTVTDATSCSYYGEVVISDTSTLTLNALTTAPTCIVGNDGTIDLTATSVFGPFEYAWNTGETTQDLSNLSTGMYTVTVTYAGATCTETLSVTLASVSGMLLGTVVTDAVSCAGLTGSINLTVTGGAAPFSFLWSNGDSSEDPAQLPAGTYTVTVTDASACSIVTEATVSEVPSFVLSAIMSPVPCGPGGNGGSVNLTASGGILPYTYLWTNGVTSDDIFGLVVGTYTVTVSDATGCTQTLSQTVDQAPGLVLSTLVTAAACTGACIGVIDLSVTGGVAPYLYIWSPGNSTQDILNLCPNTYTVTVSDANGCTKAASAVIVAQSSSIVLTATPTDASCNLNNGTVTLTVTGGNLPYNYNWTDGGTTQNRSNLISGTYTVTVSDSNGCSQTASVTVGQNSGLTLSAVVTASTACVFSNGAIDLSVAPSGSYTYSWSNGATHQDPTGLSPGNYTVTVSDGGTCTTVDTYNIPNNPNLPIPSAIPTPTSCDLSNGSINASVVGGVVPYIYQWSNGATTQDMSNILSGSYVLTVTGANGCTNTISVDVANNNPTFTLTPTITDASCNGNDGAIDLAVTGGTPAYNYLWVNGNTDQDQIGLSTGTYTVTVTDAAGCSQTASATVGQTSDLSVSFVKNDVSCFGGNDGAIDLSATGTATPFTYLWSNLATTQDMSGLVAGTYTVTVTDANLCSKTTNVTITQTADIVLSSLITNVLCFGGNDGAIDLSVSGGTPNYTYEWSVLFNGPVFSTSQDITGFAGTYFVRVSDLNGCFKTNSYTIVQPVQTSFSIVSLSNDCSSEAITGPNLPNVTYLWSGPNGFTSTATAITANFSGLYTLTITDANGCTATNDYTVNLSGGGACGHINGRIFHDEDESCSLDFGEPGLAGWIVRAEGANDTLYGVTDAQGKYFVGVPIGTFAMKVLVPNGLWSVCPGGAAVTVGIAGDTVAGGDFSVQAIYVCPALTVSIGTNKLRRCFADNYYQVEYCNQGTQKAEDAYITVVLDQYLTATSVSVPYIDLGSNALHIEVGDLEIGECGMFSIQVFVKCNAALGQTHCTQAFIYPDTLCAPTNTNWSGASLSVQSVCSNDSLRFIIRNDGKATMSTIRDYIVVEDGIMFRTGVLTPLVEHDSMVIAVPANGSTWRLEVGQEDFHPYPAPVGLSVEGCASSASFSTGFVNQFPTPDEAPTVDIDCTTNIGSFDPNDKHGYPVGYGADHYVRPGTDIEYLIRFQNTGTDTAFTVQIIDTLSSWLDPATIRFGASSHPYRYDLNGEGIVHFIFEDIFLPDSNTNEVASNGFAKFIIKPRFDTPLETVIENTAAIYFDFNDPVYTNTTFHRLGLNFVTVGLWQAFVPDAQVIAVPNPFSEETVLEVKGLRRNDALRLHVFDLRGNVVGEMESEDAFFHLKKGNWQSGVYLFKITQNGRLVGSGKLMAE